MLATLTCHFAGSDESHCGRYLGRRSMRSNASETMDTAEPQARSCCAHAWRLESLFEHHLQVRAGQPSRLHVQRILTGQIGIAGIERVESRSHTEECSARRPFHRLQALGRRAGSGLVCRSSLARVAKNP